MLVGIIVLTAIGGLEETFRKFSQDKLPYVGTEPSDVWRAYIPSLPHVKTPANKTFVESVRTVAAEYGFDVSAKSTSGIYTGKHAEQNTFTRTSGSFWNKSTDVLHHEVPGQTVSKLSVLEVAGTHPTLLCPCEHGTVCTTPTGPELPPICLIAPLDHDRQEDIIGTVIIVLAAITVLVGFTVNSFENSNNASS